MKRFLLGLFVAISISVYGATVLWPNGPWLETFQNGFLFGNGSIFSSLNSVPTFDNRRLDDAPKDKVYFQDFEGSSVSFTCDTDLTAADDSSTPQNGSVSKTFTQGATPPAVNAKCAGPTVTLPLLAQSKNLVEVCFQATWDGNDNEMALNIESGGSNLVQVLIPASSTAKKHCGYFSTDSTTSIDFDIEVIAQNANAVLEIDDLEIKVDPLAATDIYASSEWESYTPTGSFTNTTYSGRWKRDGDDLVLVIRAVGTGTPAAATGFTASLPSGLVADVDKLGNAVNTAFNYVGHGYVTDAGTNANRHSGRVYLTSTTSINLVVDEGTTFTSTNVFTFTTSDQVHMMARIPIAGWRDTAQGVVVKNLESSDVASANEFSAVIQNNGTATVVSESHSGFFTVTRVSQGVVRVDLPSGVFVNDLPHVTATVSAQLGSTYTGTRSAEYYGVTNNQFFVTTKFSDASSNNVIDYDFTIEVSKQGTDFVKESEKVYTLNVDSLTGNRVTGFGNSAPTLTVNDPVPFTESTDTAGAWDGDQYTVQKNNSRIIMQGSTYFNGAGNRYMALFKNNTLYKQFTYNLVAGNSVYPFVFVLSKGETSSGDVLEIRSDNAAGTLINNDNYHYITITEEYGDRGTFLGTFGQPTCYLKDVKSSGEAGGSSLATAYNTRDLNTTEGNCSFLSLSSNQFTLEAGSYNIECDAPAFKVDNNALFIYDVNDTSYVLRGVNVFNNNGDNVVALANVRGRITRNASDTFELRHYTQTAQASNGLGGAASLGDEVYSTCEITKVR